MRTALMTIAIVSLACVPQVEHRCRSDRDCTGGRCEANDWCSFPDDTCPESGHRYGEHAGGGLAGECVLAIAIDAAIDPVSRVDASIDGAPIDGGPSTPPPPSCGVAEVSPGVGHTCVRMVDGEIACWGRNNYGQLGIGSDSQALVPATIFSIPAAIAIAAGSEHTCLIDVGGAIRCWGNNPQGQIGQDAVASPTVDTPVELPSSPGGATEITAGRDHTCVLHAGGSDRVVSCWGGNGSGQLGTGAESGPTPAPVVTLSGPLVDALEVEAGHLHTCARRDGDLLCWGEGANGRLGLGGTNDVTIATVVPGISNPAALALGSDHTCAIDGSGQLLCWGRNSSGQVGRASTTLEYLTPVAVSLPGVPVEVSAGLEHTCTLLVDGTVWCFGNDQQHQLGRATLDPARGNASSAPVRVVFPSGGPLTGVASIASGQHHTCALLRAGGLFCWGINQAGQIGNGAATPTAPLSHVDLCPLDALDDEFDHAGTLDRWTLRHVPEGVATPYSRLDLGETTSGMLTVEPVAGGWYNFGTGFAAYKLVTGDFLVRASVDARNRFDEAARPTGAYNAIGLIARDPATGPSVPPGENWVVVNAGYEDPTSTLGSEVKTTDDSASVLSTSPGTPEGELAICRLGSSFHMYRRLEGDPDWILLTTYTRTDLPPTLQVGIMANSYSPPHDLRGKVDWIHYRRPASIGDCTAP